MILVTGATGSVGRELVQELLEEKATFRVVTRDPKKVEFLKGRADLVIGDLHDKKVVEQALEGVNKLFMLSLIFDEDHSADKMLIDVATKKNVQHVVKLSTLGVQYGGAGSIGGLHKEKEEYVEKSGIPWTFLRPGGFMSNTLQWVETIKTKDTVFSPTGDGKTAPISPCDIARVAACALTENGHEGKIYNLTGPELLSVPEQVKIISAVLEKPIKCVDVPNSVVADAMKKAHVPEFIVNSLSSMWDHVRNNDYANIHDGVTKVTGTRGQTFRQWCEMNREKFL